MGRISGYHDAPYQGVSQAPPTIRRKDQAEALEDCIVLLAQGLQKRPPWQLVGAINAHSGSPNGLFHRVERDAGDCILTVTESAGVASPLLWDLATLAAQTVTIDSAAQTYLNSHAAGAKGANKDMGATTIVDNTFIWGRYASAINSSATAATRPHEALIWVRGGSYAKSYTVTVSGGGTASATVHTPDGTTASDGSYVDTDKIAAALISGSGYIATDGASVSGNLSSLSGAGFTVTQIGPVISITHPTLDFSVAVSDGQGGLAMVAAKDKVQKFSDLPVKAPNGFTVRIVQQSGTSQDDFFVHFTKTAGDGTGVWEECIAPGAKLGLDPNTMPVRLINDGAWKLQIAPWKQRTTGDETLCLDPDFIGKPVQDLTFWQGRLAIVSGEGLTLSCADDPFQLYPRTLSTVIDSDPIARTNPAPGVTTYRFGVPFEGRFVLAGNNVQSELTSDGVLTPTRAIINTMTQHRLNPYIRPSFVNGKLYYVTTRGATACGVHEIAMDEITNVPVGEDLSTAAFRYIPAGVDRVAVCPNNFMVVYGTSGSSQIYVHLFRHSNGERVQNAFMRWNLPEKMTLGGLFFVDSTLYLLGCANGGWVFKMDLSPGALDQDATSTMETYLDWRVDESKAISIFFDNINNETQITMPFTRSNKGMTALVCRAPGSVPKVHKEGEYPAVNLAHSALHGTSSLVVAGDWTSTPFYLGYRYDASWTLSKIYPLDGAGKPLRGGRCTLSTIVLDVVNSPYVVAEVTAEGRLPQANTYKAYGFSDPLYGWFVPPLVNPVRYTFPVRCENEKAVIRVHNDSPYGFNILGLDWEGDYIPKSQRT